MSHLQEVETVENEKIHEGQIMSTNRDRLVGDLKTVVHDAQDILKETAEDASEKACAARERLREAVVAAKACCKNLEEKAVEGAKAADKVVRDHPYQSIGIAFGVGLLVGYIVTRK